MRTRSTILGFLAALLILGAAIASILARHAHEPASPEIRVTGKR